MLRSVNMFILNEYDDDDYDDDDDDDDDGYFQRKENLGMHFDACLKCPVKCYFKFILILFQLACYL